MLDFLSLPSNTPPKESLQLIFLHIPKTAGTSFRNSLQREYGRRTVLRVDIKNRKPPIIEIKQKEISLNSPTLPNGVKVVHGHFRAIDLHTHFSVTKDVPMVTWLRDPVARVLSSYYYFNKRLEEEVGNNDAALRLIRRLKLSPLEFARRKNNRNRMSKFLAEISLEDFRFVGIQEHYSEDLKDLAQLLDWHTSKEYVTNVSPRKQQQRDLDPDILAEIAELNALDMEIYQRGLAMREARIQNR